MSRVLSLLDSLVSGDLYCLLFLFRFVFWIVHVIPLSLNQGEACMLVAVAQFGLWLAFGDIQEFPILKSVRLTGIDYPLDPGS